MAEFLTTSGVSYHLENLITDAKKFVFLVSPFLKISKTFHERLHDASKKGIELKIIFGKDELRPNEKKSLESIKNLELYYFQNLHAKCYLNENKMVITSMNMHEFSEKNNREMGVLIDKNSDGELYHKAYEETLSILNNSEDHFISSSNRRNKNTQWQMPNRNRRGYCIRCEKRIDYNTGKPLCESCFSIWSRFGDEEYIEVVCHKCGKFENTSMARPECYNCWSSEHLPFR